MRANEIKACGAKAGLAGCSQLAEARRARILGLVLALMLLALAILAAPPITHYTVNAPLTKQRETLGYSPRHLSSSHNTDSLTLAAAVGPLTAKLTDRLCRRSGCVDLDHRPKGGISWRPWMGYCRYEHSLRVPCGASVVPFDSPCCKEAVMRTPPGGSKRAGRRRYRCALSAMKTWMFMTTPDAPEVGEALLVSAEQITLVLGSFSEGLMPDGIGVRSALWQAPGLTSAGSLWTLQDANVPQASKTRTSPALPG